MCGEERVVDGRGIVDAALEEEEEADDGVVAALRVAEGPDSGVVILVPRMARGRRADCSDSVR